jgi:hypothetical protein
MIFKKDGIPAWCKMRSADLPEFAARGIEFIVFVQRQTATFLPPNQLMDKFCLCVITKG